MSTADDRTYMRRAIDLANHGEGWVHPNPLVGAVIAKDGRILGEGYHRKYGELHAERNAIADARKKAGASPKHGPQEDVLQGATIYVTLEPCCHYGKTPPCTEAIIENKISRVVIGSRDPNPLVAGKGAKILREAGIEVVEDFLREECDALNPVFFHYIRTKEPYVIMKYAMTADGKIATRTGASKWITGEAAREEVHRIRHACMGIMAGIGTVLADDPLLNCRWTGAGGDGKDNDRTANGNSPMDCRQPIRIICDSRLRIPLDSQICQTAEEYETIVAMADPQLPPGEQTLEHPPGINLQEKPGQLTEKIRQLRRMGITILNVPQAGDQTGAQAGDQTGAQAGDQTGAQTGAEECARPGADAPASPQVDLKALMGLLGERGIDSVLLEGGGGLNDSALRAGIVHEVRAFIAPKLFGGRAKSPVEGCGVETPDQAIPMRLVETKMFGEDLMLRYLLPESSLTR